MKVGDLVRIKRQFLGPHDPVECGVVIEKKTGHVNIAFDGVVVPRHHSMIEVINESR